MKALIAYYSWSGNTKKLAELIAAKTGGALFEICKAVQQQIQYLSGGGEAGHTGRSPPPSWRSFPRIWPHTLEYAGEIRLGRREYTLVSLNG